MSANKPERVRWAVEVLSVQPDEKILEIGCGRGHAIELICKQLRNGKIVGIDRSSKAIREAQSNNQDCIDSMKAKLLNLALAELKLKEFFDKIFAVNVNVFWTDPEKEIAVLRTLMNKSSQLYLFYEPPSSPQLDKIIENCQEYFEGRLEIVKVLRKKLSSHYGVCIIAKNQTRTLRAAEGGWAPRFWAFSVSTASLHSHPPQLTPAVGRYSKQRGKH